MQKRCKFTARELARLEAHFCRHAAVVERFRHAAGGDWALFAASQEIESLRAELAGRTAAKK